MSFIIKIGTRGSPLALAQTNLFAEALRGLDPECETEIIRIKTSGDRIQDRFLNTAGGKGLFVKEIEDALLGGEIDLAVHSLKDVPAKIPEALVLACFPKRISHRDVLITPQGLGFAELPQNALVGTVSLRRRLQMHRVRSDLRFGMLRGNIDTRIRRMNGGEYSAIVLAEAGLLRLGVMDTFYSPLDLIPAPGQGCLAIEINRNNSKLFEFIQPIHDQETEIAVLAERRVMEALGGGCNLPLGALGEVDGPSLRLQAFIASPDGGEWIEEQARGPARDPAVVADQLLEAMRALGAEGIVQKIQHV